MSSSLPILLSMSHASMSRGDTMHQRLQLHLSRRGRALTRPKAHDAVSRFALCDDESRFAKAVVYKLPHLWVFRARQNAFCGDFALVDMSKSQPQLRDVVIVELKRSGRLTEGGGGCSNQLSRFEQGVIELEQRGLVIAPLVTLLCGSGDDVVQRLSKSRSAPPRRPWAA